MVAKALNYPNYEGAWRHSVSSTLKYANLEHIKHLQGRFWCLEYVSREGSLERKRVRWHGWLGDDRPDDS